MSFKFHFGSPENASDDGRERQSKMSQQNWAEYEQSLLLGGTWLPVTSCILFAHAPAQVTADTLISGVRGRYVVENYGHPMKARPISARSLEEFLPMLFPLF